MAWQPLVWLLSWYPLIPVKSLQLIWRSGTRRFHLRVPDLQMSCSSFTQWMGTSLAAPASFHVYKITTTSTSNGHQGDMPYWTKWVAFQCTAESPWLIPGHSESSAVLEMKTNGIQSTCLIEMLGDAQGSRWKENDLSQQGVSVIIFNPCLMT